MTIRFSCNACGKRLRADEEIGGKTIRCTRCNEPVTIPYSSTREPGKSESDASCGDRVQQPPLPRADSPPQDSSPVVAVIPPCDSASPDQSVANAVQSETTPDSPPTGTRSPRDGSDGDSEATREQQATGDDGLSTNGWYVGTPSGTPEGPFSINEIRVRAADGRLTATHLLWRESMPDWVPATSIGSVFPDSNLATASMGLGGFSRGLAAMATRLNAKIRISGKLARVLGRLSSLAGLSLLIASAVLRPLSYHWYTWGALLVLVGMIGMIGGSFAVVEQRLDRIEALLKDNK